MALLIYLAVEGNRRHRRDRLAGLLWPNVHIAEGRHSLATALSVLRPRLGIKALDTTREAVSLSPTSVRLDLDRLLQKDILGSETTGLLDVAGFLDGFEVPDAPEFGFWKDQQQARLIPLIKDAIVILIDRCRQRGDTNHIEQLADRMLMLDDLSEEAIRAKMEARAMAGDRLTAVKVYEEWKARLGSELQALPSQTIEQMAKRLRRGGWERAAVDAIAVNVPSRMRERVFVGRGSEYEDLYAGWQTAKAGHAAHWVILGDSGIGKTTLAERLTTAAALEGAAVARVQGYDVERNIPFATLGGLVTYLLECPGAAASPAEALAELAKTFPEVRRRFPALPSATSSEGEPARIRLTEGFCQLLRAIAEDHPVVLVVDDLHLADEASLAVLHIALRRTTDIPLMAILLARPGELAPSSQATLLYDSIRRLGGAELLLQPLGEAHCHELLSYLLGGEGELPTRSIRDSIAAASGGVPMVMELLVQDWRAHGSGSGALALDAMTADFVNTGARDAFAPLFTRVLGGLETTTKNALELAAVLGRRLNDLNMYSLIDLSLGQTMRCLGQLSDRRVLRDGQSGLEFANEMLRAHVYAAIPSSLRKALHASVADRLSALDNNAAPALTLEIAWHTMRAGRLKDSIPVLFEGARDAIRQGAPYSAERALSSAIHQLQGLDKSRATLLLVEALQEQGRWRESVDTLEVMPEDTSPESCEEAFALKAVARAYLAPWTQTEALALLPQLVSIIRTSAHNRTRIRAARAAAHLTSPLRDRERGQSLLNLVRAIPSTDLDAGTRIHLCLVRAMLLYQIGNLEGSYLEACAGLDDCRQMGAADFVAVQLQFGMSITRALQGRYDEAVEHGERAHKMANFLGNDDLALRIAANLAISYGRLGRLEDQLRCSEEHQHLSSGKPVTWYDFQLTYSIAAVHGMHHRVGQARAALEALESRLQADLPEESFQRWLLWKADALMLSGLTAEAMETARAATVALGLVPRSDALAGPFARWTALVCSGTEYEGQARATLKKLADNLEDYDAFDRVEILCACAQMNRESKSHIAEQIRVLLDGLPGYASTHLRALGMHIT